MKIITLTKGKIAFVSDCDFKLLNHMKWHASLNSYSGRGIRKPLDKWYAKSTFLGRKIYMHRFIMGEPEDMVVNHINANGLDNRRENLEIVTQAKNTEHSRFGADDYDFNSPVPELEDII